jgi:hypothetical protein
MDAIEKKNGYFGMKVKLLYPKSLGATLEGCKKSCPHWGLKTKPSIL